MKKTIFAIFLCLLTVFATGCSATTSVSQSGSYWLKNSKITEVADVNESCEYSVTVEKNEKSSITPTLSGSYTTSLTKDVYNETVCYKLVASLTLSGSYEYKGDTVPVDDFVHSEIYFLGEDKNLKPLFVQKRVKSTSPVEDLNGNVEFKEISYDYSIAYGKTATVNFNETSADKVFSLKNEFEKKLSYKSFCENELLLFYPRMFNLAKDGIVSSVKTYDVTTNKISTASIAVQSKNKDMKVDLLYTDTTVFKALHKDSVKTDCVSLSLSGTYSGPSIYAYYVTLDDRYTRASLIKVETPVYLVGKLVYNLKTFETV